MSKTQHQAVAISARNSKHQNNIGVVLSGASRVESVDELLFVSIQNSGFDNATKQLLMSQLRTIEQQLRIVHNSMQLQQDALQHFERIYTLQQQTEHEANDLWSEWLGMVNPMLSPEFTLYTREETAPQQLYGLKQRAIPSYLLHSQTPTHEQVRQGLEFWYSENTKLQKKLGAFKHEDAVLRVKLENVLAANPSHDPDTVLPNK